MQAESTNGELAGAAPTIREQQIAAILAGIAEQYPEDLVAGQQRDIPRIAFHIRAAIEAAPPKPINELAICDIGGGIGMFSVGCAAVGFRSVMLIDDFRDRVNEVAGDDVLELHRGYGVDVCCRDIIEEGMAGLADAFDVVTSFDSMEHWHCSPKELFRDVVSRLTDGGGFLLGVPNCVNLRKRITVPFGYGKWSSIDDWYEQDRFRGHVREPDVADLRYIANDLGLRDVRVFGRNWLGGGSASRLLRLITLLADRPLRMMPALCSDIYVIGKKPCTVEI